MGIFAAVVSTNALTLAAPQYPFFPGGGPSLTRPSGQRGAGADAADARRAGATNNLLPVLFNTTDFANACLLSPRAGVPSTLTMSPMRSELCFQPSLSRSSGLPNSTAQFVAAPPASLTSMK